MIIGGFNNRKNTDNPTVSRVSDIYQTKHVPDFVQLEFFPPKGNGQPIHSQFLRDALPSNLFPHVSSIFSHLVRDFKIM